MIIRKLTSASIIAVAAMASASCGQAQTGDSEVIGPFAVETLGTFSEGWAIAVEPGTGTIFLTEKGGTAKFVRANGTIGEVTGLPEVAYGGQGGLGDMVFSPDYETSKMVYLTFAEASEGAENGERNAAMGRGVLECGDTSCEVKDFEVIWRANPPIASPGHFSHKIAFSPDGEHLFLTAGERMQGDPSQDTSNNLGAVLRLKPDGTPADGNPLVAVPGASRELWSWGHRNLTGLHFAPDGNLWEMEHGPAGGDELNLIKPNQNYGWPVVSGGNNYDGSPIPPHSAHPEFTPPAINWTPVITPGDFTIYTGDAFPDFNGNILVAGLRTQSIVRIRIEGEDAVEMERFEFPRRLRDIDQTSDGAILLVEDGPNGRLLKLTPAG